MKIYRYPQTDPTKFELTDEISFSESENIVGFRNAKSIDITIDKDGQRGSMAYLEFEESDLENIHHNYIHYLKSKIRKLERDLHLTIERGLKYKRMYLESKAHWSLVNDVMEDNAKWYQYLNHNLERGDDKTSVNDLIASLAEDLSIGDQVSIDLFNEKLKKKYEDYMDWNIDPEEYKEL